MKNERIQKWLAVQGAHVNPSTSDREAYEIVVALAAPEGAVAIADEASWELLMGECRALTSEGFTWWVIETEQPTLDLHADAMVRVATAVRYLLGRGLLVQHPGRADLVRELSANEPSLIG